jgi:serine protease Do
VPIDPADSGGPLFDLTGKVASINSRIFSYSGGYIGLPFAIPANRAMDVMAQPRTGSFVPIRWLTACS